MTGGGRENVSPQSDDPTRSGLLVLPGKPPEQESSGYVNHIDRPPDNGNRPNTALVPVCDNHLVTGMKESNVAHESGEGDEIVQLQIGQTV